MAIQTVNSNSMIPLINGFKELDMLIISYLSTNEVTILAGNSSPYCSLAAVQSIFAIRQRDLVQFAKEKQASIALGFDECILQTFWDRDLSLWHIPRLNLSENSSSVYTIQKDISMARLQYKGKPALVLNLNNREKIDNNKSEEADNNEPFNITFYKISLTPPLWTSTTNDVPPVENFPWGPMPPNDMSRKLKEIFSGTHAYRLVSEIPQVDSLAIKEAEKTEAPST